MNDRSDRSPREVLIMTTLVLLFSSRQQTPPLRPIPLVQLSDRTVTRAHVRLKCAKCLNKTVTDVGSPTVIRLCRPQVAACRAVAWEQGSRLALGRSSAGQ